MSKHIPPLLTKYSTKSLQDSDFLAFELERKRKELLKKKFIKKLLSTYSEKLPTHKDQNTGRFWDKKFTEEIIDHPMEDYRNKLISDFIIRRGKKKLNILDIGVGRGKIERLTHGKVNGAVSFTCTDFTLHMLQQLKKEFPKHTFLHGNILNISFKEKFDIILLLEVLEHIKPAETFSYLRKINGILNDEGTFVISIPVNEGLEKMYPLNPNSHMREYSRDLITFELIHSGFQIEKIIELSAFKNNFKLKHFLNYIFKLKEPNNLIIFCKKP